MWTGQISAVQQHFLTIASFLTLIQDWSADSTILIGPQSSCNTVEISWTQTPCKKVIICQTDCTIYCWLIVTVDTPAPVHLMKQLKYATGWSWFWMWLVDKMQRCAKIQQNPVSTHKPLLSSVGLISEITNENVLKIFFPISLKNTSHCSENLWASSVHQYSDGKAVYLKQTLTWEQQASPTPASTSAIHECSLPCVCTCCFVH